jgi:hypothetical protein
MTDIAARPPQSYRFRRDRPNLERRAGMAYQQLAVVCVNR